MKKLTLDERARRSFAIIFGEIEGKREREIIEMKRSHYYSWWAGYRAGKRGKRKRYKRKAKSENFSDIMRVKMSRRERRICFNPIRL